MSKMTSRERVLRTFRFEETDRPPFDLQEGALWPELEKWWAEQLGLKDKDAAFDHFGIDFRWAWVLPKPPEGLDHSGNKYFMPLETAGTYSSEVIERPLATVRTVDEMLEKHAWCDPLWLDVSPVKQAREDHPDKAIVMIVYHTMLFMTSCDFFGIEEALMRLLTDDPVMIAFLERQNEFAVGSFRHACKQAKGHADICWFMDDVATQRALMMDPDLWRRHFKEYLRQQVEVMHEYGMRALFHSCASIQDILPDLIEIGVDGVLPFQTSSDGMDAESIARDFGGKIVFYGGMDIQQLLTFGTEEEVRAEVAKNCSLFSSCGGHVVANSHHQVANISSHNICTMLEEARKPRPVRAS